MRVVGIVGRSGSGKTTLIEKLIGAIRARGLTVSTIKHTHHHDFQLEPAGKDSARHRRAGASEVLLASDSGWVRITESRRPESLAGLLQQLQPVDVVLVEGFKQLESLRRVEVFRGTGEPLAATDPGIAAVALPDGVTAQNFRGTRLPLDDPEKILDFVLST
ncbi:MAG TPA: molybdopterin-guanine dinucleotide biosynthesis protein B [Steroidobacteraceae bacterium]|jgi:molybdopterin-guanine dinucleotide biosynthesis protein B|nr:molybdopterin-guanine dinucleotide biosynthesis protein B [Steroidobacteraceae bacterium]